MPSSDHKDRIVSPIHNLMIDSYNLPGAVILLGRTNMFRFNNPAEAAKMKKELKKVG